MALVPGARLGAYEVISPLGAGGMGEVYRARDTRLGREVAIKVLPDTFVDDAERLARFKREAHLLASLNHPHIATIYGLEETASGNALVLELVDGPTLADRLARGPIPLEEALPMATQIVEALEAAHERGIIHRDLKPANIKLTADGDVKILDFGLAKASDSGTGRHQADVSASPTITSPAMTLGGMVLGTAAYMSPEQARGKVVDKRTDVWAFGCVLYEMLTARRAFDGEDVSDVLAAILRGEPDSEILPSNTPISVRRLLRRCLAKDKKYRLADMADASLELIDAREAPREITQVVKVGSSRVRTAMRWAMSGIGALLLVAAIARYNLPDASHVFSYHAFVLPAPGTAFGSQNTTPASFMALSPDGQSLAYVATDALGKTMLWVRPLNSPVATALAGTENAREPFWSSDSRALGFVADGKLKRVDKTGSSVTTLANAAAQTGSWNRDGVILFTPTNNSAVHSVAESGGPVSPVTTLDASAGERMHDGPVFLSDGDHFIYVGVGSHTTGPNQARGIFLGSLSQPGAGKLLLGNGSNAQYANGYLLFLRDTTLLAQRLDINTLSLVGQPSTIAENVLTGGTTGRGGAFSVSQAGVLVFQTGASDTLSRLVWIDRNGKEISVLGQPREYSDVELSDDGKFVTTAILNPAQRSRDIWIIDVGRNVPTMFTFDVADEWRSVWSPDGKWLAFARRREGTMDLYRKSVFGPLATEEKLLDRGIPVDWSPDGRHILFLRSASQPAGQLDLWVLSLDTRQIQAYAATPFNEPSGVFSPDGRWIAYVSAETGSPEVYVDRFPEPGQKHRVSTGGGSFVRWARNGRELVYGNANGTLVTTAIDTSETPPHIGPTTELFRAQVKPLVLPMDIAADGKRLLLNSSSENRFSAPISLVLNWPRLVDPP